MATEDPKQPDFDRMAYMRLMMEGAAKDRSEIRAKLAIAKAAAKAKKGPDAGTQTNQKTPA